jgi:hypothetical protein
VYGEDEYLAGSDAHADEQTWTPGTNEGPQVSPAADDPSRVLGGAANEDVRAAPPHRVEGHPTVVSPRPSRSRPGRLVGLGLLVGVTVGAFALVALNASHRAPMAPQSGVAQSPRVGAVSRTSTANDASDASNASAGLPTNPGPVHPATVPISHARVSVRSLARSLSHQPSRAESPTESTPIPSSMEPWQSQQSTPELPEPDVDVPATAVAGEFDFER